MVAMADERAFTVAEVAERLQVSVWTVRDWLREGRLRGYRLGGRRVGWRVDEEDLEAFKTELKRQSQPRGQQAE